MHYNASNYYQAISLWARKRSTVIRCDAKNAMWATPRTNFRDTKQTTVHVIRITKVTIEPQKYPLSRKDKYPSNHQRSTDIYKKAIEASVNSVPKLPQKTENDMSNGGGMTGIHSCSNVRRVASFGVDQLNQMWGWLEFFGGKHEIRINIKYNPNFCPNNCHKNNIYLSALNSFLTIINSLWGNINFLGEVGFPFGEIHPEVAQISTLV